MKPEFRDELYRRTQSAKIIVISQYFELSSNTILSRAA